MMEPIENQNLANMNTQLEVNTMRKQPGHTFFTKAIFGALAVLSGSVVMAGSLTVPNTFTSGTAATAASLNDNFP